MSWFSNKWKEFDAWVDAPSMAEEVEVAFDRKKLTAPYKLTSSEIGEQIEKLHAETRRIKRAGVSMWNYKEVLPRIFDVVDGAFVAMKEVVLKLEELEAKLEKENDIAK